MTMKMEITKREKTKKKNHPNKTTNSSDALGKHSAISPDFYGLVNRLKNCFLSVYPKSTVWNFL